MRSTRGTSLVAALALAALLGLLGSLLVASPAAAVDWTTVPGARSDDLIVTPIEAGQQQAPGFSYTARSSGIADYCAATAAGRWPCPTVDYHDYFTLTSATVTGRVATVTLVATTPNFGLTWLSMTSWMSDHWEQVFSTSNHGWVYYPEIIGGRQVGQSNQEQIVCTIGVPCTVSYGLNDDFTRFTGDKWLAAQVNGSQIFIPLTGQTAPATPPTAAFSYSFTGVPARTWSFDGSASTAVTGKTVASYRWDFGDGSTAVTTTATTTHTYADMATSRTVSLVVTDSAGTASASVSHTLTEPALVVNSTGDAPAADPRAGCDTGQTIANGDKECTLRAAIQALDAGVGGTTISFSVPAGSTITAASALPDITRAGAKIDGGSVVPIISGSALLVNGAAGVTITKVSVVGSGDFGVRFENAPGATLTSSFVGVTPDGRVSAPKEGVDVGSSGAVTIGDSTSTGNVIVGSNLDLGGAPITSLRVVGNALGFRPDGSLVAGAGTSIGLMVGGVSLGVAGADIESNRIAGAVTNVAMLGSGLTAPTIKNNLIGVAADQDTVLGSTTAINLRLDGVPGAQVTGNQIAGAGSCDVLVSGSMQTTSEPDPTGGYRIHFRVPGDNDVLTGPVTGIGDVFSGNRIGTTTRHAAAADTGFRVWNAGNSTTIANNTIVDHDYKELWLTGAATGLQVTGNTIGRPIGVEASVNTAAVIEDQTSPVISGNTVGGEGTAISIAPTTTGASIAGNTIGMWTDGRSADPVGYGISVSGPNATIGPDNVIGYATAAGIQVRGANPTVVGNRIGVPRFGTAAAGNQIGIQVQPGATGTVIGGSASGSGNTIANNGIGIDLEQAGAEVAGNTLGIITSGAAGNSYGISAQKDASIHNNTIANSARAGVLVGASVVVKILHNSIYATATGVGIESPNAGPTSVAAARVIHGSSARTWLVLRNVSTDPGTIEVFGNASCSDAEGKVPLFTTPTTAQSLRVLSIADRTDLEGLTVTVTTASGTTQFSSCQTSGPAEDSDGDGIPDVVEAAYPLAPEAALVGKVAAFVGDNQQWVSLAANGDLHDVTPIDDPDPNGHPGATFPLGLINWTVSGIEPGSNASVAFTLPGTTINGWWKYNATRSPQYFDYGYSRIAGYGAQVVNANLPLFGLSSNVVLIVPDGGVGDDDGLENGSVTDPSAPAAIAAAAPAPTVVTTAATAAALAATGMSDPTPGLLGGLALIILGTGLVLTRRIRRRRAG